MNTNSRRSEHVEFSDITGYENLAAFETAQEKLTVDPGWLEYIDSTNGCYVEDSAITQSTLYTKLA